MNGNEETAQQPSASAERFMRAVRALSEMPERNRREKRAKQKRGRAVVKLGKRMEAKEQR